jgi:hypothetical protein
MSLVIKASLILLQNLKIMFDTTSIKHLFYNSVGYNTAEIVVSSNNQTMSLFYHLNDNPVQHLWQDIHKDSSKFIMRVSNGTSIEKLVEMINLLLRKTNRKLLEFPISQDQLNQLHHSFVENRMKSESEDDCNINILIHAIESKNNFLTEYDCTITFTKDPNNIKIPIKEEYKLWLMNENRWGHLLLGFGTLGKSLNDIVKSNDSLEDLAIQSTISSETSMIFSVDHPYRKAEENRLYQWAKSSIQNVPLDNLNQLSLGSYFLGEIIITDVFLDFHPVISDWYLPNHKCKLMWNKDVLGYGAEIKQIKFFNSDMYFDSLFKHAKLGDVCSK